MLIDSSTLGQCQIAVAETVKVFGTIDVLFCCANESMSITAHNMMSVVVTMAADGVQLSLVLSKSLRLPRGL